MCQNILSYRCVAVKVQIFAWFLKRMDCHMGVTAPNAAQMTLCGNGMQVLVYTDIERLLLSFLTSSCMVDAVTYW